MKNAPTTSKIQTTKIVRGDLVLINTVPVRVKGIDVDFCWINSKGINGRKTRTDYGKVILTTSGGIFKLGKRIKLEILH